MPMTLTLELDPQLEAAIERLMASGRYGSRVEAVREVLLEAGRVQSWAAKVNAGIERGIADAEAGRLVDAETVRRELKSRYAAMPSKDPTT